MIIIGIDIGSRNVGVCMMQKSDKINIICSKVDLSHISYTTLETMYVDFQLHRAHTVVIEQQFRGRTNLINYGMVSMFFQSKNKQVVSLKPPCYSMGIKGYKNRKAYTSNFYKDILRQSKLVVQKTCYKKIDDMADALFLCCKYANCHLTIPVVDSVQIM